MLPAFVLKARFSSMPRRRNADFAENSVAIFELFN
jgi:hypothetical protein